MSNNLSKLLVPAGVDLVVERAFRGHEFLEGSVFHDVPGVEVDDVVGSLQVAEVVGDADRRRVSASLSSVFWSDRATALSSPVVGSSSR